jgi:RHS repeat-associated protein
MKRAFVVLGFAFLLLGISPGDLISSPSFAPQPKDQDFFQARVFEEPLVPSTEAINPAENKALALALNAYHSRKDPEDFSSIEKFFETHPNSRWECSLRLNVGLALKRYGYFTRAWEQLEKSWKLGRGNANPIVEDQAVRAAIEHGLLLTWVGRVREVETLLEELETSRVDGVNTQRLDRVKEGLWFMKHKPGESFKCGPKALSHILLSRDSKAAPSELLRAAKSPSHGFSLAEIETMSDKVGLKFQAAFREKGAEVIVPAVVHWKLNHYSALNHQKNGKFYFSDSTLGTGYSHQYSISLTALEAEASGYYLVPSGKLPKGWRKVGRDEAKRIFGQGAVQPDNGKHVSLEDLTTGSGCHPWGMPVPEIHLAAASLTLRDIPIYYETPKGESFQFLATYLQRDTGTPTTPTYSNLGKQWAHNWLSFITDDPTDTTEPVDLYARGGGTRTFTYDHAANGFKIEIQTKDQLVRLSPTSYEIRANDGSREVYSQPDGSTSPGRRIFLTEVHDSAGNMVRVTYDSQLRIKYVIDALSQTNSFIYNGSDLKISAVEDFSGRQASFQYTGDRLTTITDMSGLSSTLIYQSNGVLSQLLTPYGATTFKFGTTSGSFSKWLTVKTPDGETEKVEFVHDVTNYSEEPIPAMPLPESKFLNHNNTFYWDKRALRESSGYEAATAYHWLGDYSTEETGVVSPILSSIKRPGENRSWYSYQGQMTAFRINEGMSSKPGFQAKVLDDGSTQLHRFEYNSLGNRTRAIDPVGRESKFIYAPNEIDLLEVQQKVGSSYETLAKYTYNSQHRPLTATDAAGQTTTFSYNPAGQIKTINNALNQTTTFNYNSKGFVTNIVGAVSAAVTSFTYDTVGRVKTIKDSQGYTLTYNYDLLNRITKVTYPDGSTEEMVYANLHLDRSKDREGRWTRFHHDKERRLTGIVNPIGQLTQFLWCGCGSLEAIIDASGNKTTWMRDLLGRPVAKIFSDGKVNEFSYSPESGRLLWTKDAKGQFTNFSYNPDDTISQIDYGNAGISTPTVNFSYDPWFPRLARMKDGLGTTTNIYNPIGTSPGLGAGQLKSVNGPLSNDTITFSYDKLGRVTTNSVNGAQRVVSYDSLGRVNMTSNSLGRFTYTYVNATGRMNAMNFPNGQVTSFSYFSNTGDQRLKEIHHKKSSGSTISKFSYEYDREGQIKKWIEQADSQAPTAFDFTYDGANQLLSAVKKNTSTSAILEQFAYQYDNAGNRTSEMVNTTGVKSTFNKVNQLLSQSGGGSRRFAGQLTEPSTVTVKGKAATVNADNSFEAFVDLPTGESTVPVIARDLSGNNNVSTNKYQVNVSAGMLRTVKYDANGNTTNIVYGSNVESFKWDAADRMVEWRKIAGSTTNQLNVSYDGLGRGVRYIKKLNSTSVTNWHVWNGLERAEERSGTSGTLLKRFFPQGVETLSGSNTGKLFYTRDHSGSIREVTDSGQAVKGRFAYDPYGKRKVVSGADFADFGFTGHLFHAESGLHLAPFRAYSAELGRWLSKDPIGEDGGLNLYQYALSDPINLMDQLGLDVGASGRDASYYDQPESNWDKFWNWLNPPPKPNQTVAVFHIPFISIGGPKAPKLSAPRTWPKHHPWPKYLGGWRDQTLKKLPPCEHRLFHSALDKWQGGKYARNKGADHYKDMNPNQIIQDLREFYKTAEGGRFSQYLDDFEQAVKETLQQH